MQDPKLGPMTHYEAFPREARLINPVHGCMLKGLDGQAKKGVTERKVFAFACQYIVSRRRRSGNRTLTQFQHPLLVTSNLRARITCQYIVGACGHCSIVLSSRSPRKCGYPLFAYPLRKTGPTRGFTILGFIGACLTVLRFPIAMGLWLFYLLHGYQTACQKLHCQGCTWPLQNFASHAGRGAGRPSDLQGCHPDSGRLFPLPPTLPWHDQPFSRYFCEI